MQAECLGAAYRLWRRNWKGRGREYTAGALVWQINDWFVTFLYLSICAAWNVLTSENRSQLANNIMGNR
jgi:hypothetical protein